MDTNRAELIDLASKFQDEALTDVELARLNELLHDPTARQLFADLGILHFCLRADSLSAGSRLLADRFTEIHRAIIPEGPVMSKGQVAVCLPARHSPGRPSASISASVSAARSSLFRLATTVRGRVSGRSVAALAASVLVVVAASLYAVSNRQQPSVTQLSPEHDSRTAAVLPHVDLRQDEFETTDAARPGQMEEFIARIVAMSRELRWEPNGAPGDVLMRLQHGERVRIAAGLLKFEFGSGATLVLQGPADIETLTQNSARLWRGAVTGRCEAGNFTLMTPQAKVIDVGTEFGVSVDRQRDALVTVFDGEVHVKSTVGNQGQAKLHRLTTGMSLGIDSWGVMATQPARQSTEFQRDFQAQHAGTLGTNEFSLVDVIGGSEPGEWRPAGAINPMTGAWDKTPWTQSLGVKRLDVGERLVPVDWNRMIDGVFVPVGGESRVTIDSAGHEVSLHGYSGAAWGPVWARRRTNGDLDPNGRKSVQTVNGFWGVGTVDTLYDRLFWARDGLVGLHANVGVTIDLDEIRRHQGRSIQKLRGVVAFLELSRVSQPFQPNSRADFRVYVDGQLRYERAGFCRADGDAQFGTLIGDHDRFLTLLVTEGGDGTLFDRVILIDPVFELVSE